jgi:hypothetical protein
MDFKIEVEVSVEMKVIWLRKQDPYSAAWVIQNRAIELKRYLRGNPEAIAALNRLEQIGAEISRAISEGDTDKVTQLAEEASDQKSAVAQAMAEAKNVTDEARKFFLDMSDAIRALGGY